MKIKQRERERDRQRQIEGKEQTGNRRKAEREHNKKWKGEIIRMILFV